MIYLELKFSEEELAQIEALSGAGYSPEKIAMYLDVDKKSSLKNGKIKIPLCVIIMAVVYY